MVNQILIDVNEEKIREAMAKLNLVTKPSCISKYLYSSRGW